MVPPFLSQADTERLMHAFITSRQTLSCLVFQRQLLVNFRWYRMLLNESSPRLDGRCTSHTFYNPCTGYLLLAELDFKMILQVYKSLHSHAPDYISGKLSRYAPSRSLRSFGTEQFQRPGPRDMVRQVLCSQPLEYSIPEILRKDTTVETFKRNLKTYLFDLTYYSLWYALLQKKKKKKRKRKRERDFDYLFSFFFCGSWVWETRDDTFYSLISLT